MFEHGVDLVMLLIRYIRVMAISQTGHHLEKYVFDTDSVKHYIPHKQLNSHNFGCKTLEFL